MQTAKTNLCSAENNYFKYLIKLNVETIGTWLDLEPLSKYKF